MQTLCILGGTGFVGQRLVSHLANAGYRLRVITRHRHRHRELLVMPRVTLIETDGHDAETLKAQFAGCAAVINLIGRLNGTAAEFRRAHVELPGLVATLAGQAKVPRLLHMSALGADAEHGPSLYLRSKGEGERAVRAVPELKTTLFRPSVIFGPDDGLFQRFATLLGLSPILPLACPQARIAPVFVDDVVSAFALALDNPATFGQTLELCGPRSYTLRELVTYTAELIGRRTWIVNLPDGLARLQARILTYFPGQPFTLDNYRSLQVDSVCHGNGLETLGIVPQSVESVMPAYFAGQLSRAVRYHDYRLVARHDSQSASGSH